MSAPKVYTLTRIRPFDGEVHVVEVPTLREARKHVAWCMTDNALQTRKDALLVSERLVVGEVLYARGYRFELVAS